MASQSDVGKLIVVDSSVIIKWFSEEEDTYKALILREKHINGETLIISPDLALYEIANALRYNKNVTQNEIKEAVESLFGLGLNIVIPTTDILNKPFL